MSPKPASSGSGGQIQRETDLKSGSDAPMMAVLSFFLPEANPDDLLLDLEDIVPWGWQEVVQGDRVEVRIHCLDHEQAHLVSERLTSRCPDVHLEISRAEVRDWSSAWREYFKPVLVAEKFLVLPPWETCSERTAGIVPITIEPRMAFGTGHHATTNLCLHVLARLWATKQLKAGTSFLDVGTGSGILAIGAALLGISGVGLDSDPIAVDNARENVQLNKVGDQVALFTGSVDCLKAESRYDLILANILADPLITMAPALSRHLAPTGVLVLSGLLHRQEDRVIRGYAVHNLNNVMVLRQDEWSALVFSPDRA